METYFFDGLESQNPKTIFSMCNIFRMKKLHNASADFIIISEPNRSAKRALSAAFGVIDKREVCTVRTVER
jgi:hypothetical protein